MLQKKLYINSGEKNMMEKHVEDVINKVLKDKLEKNNVKNNNKLHYLMKMLVNKFSVDSSNEINNFSKIK